MAVFYEWVDTHDKIIAQGEHYTIIAKKHLVREEQLIPSLQVKVGYPKTREVYLEALIGINDMPSSREGSEAMSHQSLNESIAEAVDEMIDR